MAGELIVDDLTVSIESARGAVRPVDSVSLTVPAGTTAGIVGESGSGKTMLSRAIMGLLPSTASVSGSVYLDGRELTALPPAQLRQTWATQMAMVFQDPMTSLNPVKRVGVQVTEALRFHGKIERREASTRAVELLDAVGIASPERRSRQYPHELSGGMRQRVTIAMALSCDPSLLIADEATTALDVTVQAQILDLLDDQQRSRAMTMIVVSHDLGVIASRTDLAVVMYAGQVVEAAPTSDLFAKPRHPYTVALLEARPRLDRPSGSSISSIAGRPPDLARTFDGCRFEPRCKRADDQCRTSPPALTASHAPTTWVRCFHPTEATVELSQRPRR